MCMLKMVTLLMLVTHSEGEKTLNMFRSLRNEFVEEAEKSREPKVLNLKGALVMFVNRASQKEKLLCLLRYG